MNVIKSFIYSEEKIYKDILETINWININLKYDYLVKWDINLIFKRIKLIIMDFYIIKQEYEEIKLESVMYHILSIILLIYLPL